ncbi:hypothetical protein [Rahnella aceris]|uniref:hypothetical protein n=1 Tax=Rahnella sp. (strain Y9602) TaxID=2703885 RepID=UPI00359FD146
MALKNNGAGVYVHVDFPTAEAPVFNRGIVRRAFFKIGMEIQSAARSQISQRHGSTPGQNPGYHTGATARSIGYYVPSATKSRPGMMVRIAPNQKRGRGATPLPLHSTAKSNGFYPAYLFYGVKQGAVRGKKHHKGASGGSGWRVAPRENYMLTALQNKKYWTERVLFKALKRAVKPKKLDP